MEEASLRNMIDVIKADRDEAKKVMDQKAIEYDAALHHYVALDKVYEKLIIELDGVK